MSVQITESIWLNTTSLCTFEQLSEVSGLSTDTLRDLIDVGAIEPAQTAPAQGSTAYVFKTETIVIARRARRLRDDFELDASGLALALRLMQRIDNLQAELDFMSAKLMPGDR